MRVFSTGRFGLRRRTGSIFSENVGKLTVVHNIRRNAGGVIFENELRRRKMSGGVEVGTDRSVSAREYVRFFFVFVTRTGDRNMLGL